MIILIIDYSNYYYYYFDYIVSSSRYVYRCQWWSVSNWPKEKHLFLAQGPDHWQHLLPAPNNMRFKLLLNSGRQWWPLANKKNIQNILVGSSFLWAEGSPGATKVSSRTTLTKSAVQLVLQFFFLVTCTPFVLVAWMCTAKPKA